MAPRDWTSERGDETSKRRGGASEHAAEPAMGRHTVLYTAIAAVAVALVATAANEVFTAAASADLAAPVRGDPWLLVEADAALARASAAASRAAFLTRVAAAAVIAWAGLRVAVRWRA